MNATNITDSDIGSYLLGALEGETAESIDELTFLDTDFAARVDAVERDLIDEYLRRELDADSARRFESYYLRSAKRREKMRLGASFGEFVAAAAPNIQHPIRAHPVEEPNELRTGFWWKFAIPAFAAAILLAVAVPLWFNSSTTQQQLANINADTNSNQLAQVQPTVEPSPSGVPTASPSAVERPVDQAVPRANDNRRVAPPSPRVFAFSLTPQMRGSQGERRFSIPEGTETVAVSLRLEPTEFTSVRVELRDGATGRTVWQGRFRPATSGAFQSVSFRIPEKLVGPGRYSFVATGLSQGSVAEVIGDYPFRIVP